MRDFKIHHSSFAFPVTSFQFFLVTLLLLSGCMGAIYDVNFKNPVSLGFYTVRKDSLVGLISTTSGRFTGDYASIKNKFIVDTAEHRINIDYDGVEFQHTDDEVSIAAGFNYFLMRIGDSLEINAQSDRGNGRGRIVMDSAFVAIQVDSSNLFFPNRDTIWF